MACYTLVCTDCHFEAEEDRYHVMCPKCNGFLEVKLESVDRFRRPDPNFKSIFKYHPFMPFDVSDKSVLDFETIEETPVLSARKISECLDIELFVKDETIYPTGTWKDREGFVSLYRLWKNDISDLVLFSSGNTGTSLARSASLFKGPRLHLFVPQASKERIDALRAFYDPAYVKVHYGEGSNDECIAQSRAFAQEHHLVAEGGFRNYARREGLKLFGLEYLFAWSQMMSVDWYVQAVAGGIGIYSFYKAHVDTEREGLCPRMLGVQAEVCSPMVNAWKDGSNTLEDRHVPQEIVPSDFVRVLRTRKPVDSYPVLKRIMNRVDGRFESVSDREIYEALRLFYLEDYFKAHHHERGITIGLEAAAALAGVVKGVREGYIQKGTNVLLNASGAAKEGDVKMEWIRDLLD